MQSAAILVGKEREARIMPFHMVLCKGAGTEWITALLGRGLRNCGNAANATHRVEKCSRFNAGTLIERGAEVGR